MEWIFLILFAGLISVLFFGGSKYFTEKHIDNYYSDINVIRDNNNKNIQRLQQYINLNEIASSDTDLLNKWMRRNRILYIQIQEDNRIVYTSDPYMDESVANEFDLPVSIKDSQYEISMADGMYSIFIIGMYSYRAYMVALAINITASFFIFTLITMIGIRKKIEYIKKISKDIEILEGGNLEYNVRIQGNDEITQLAKGLNAMKTSFANQINDIEHLTDTNKKMVTEISHDLRTPLTSIILYAELIKDKRYKDETEFNSIMDKLIKKMMHLKSMSDDLLEHAVRNSEDKYIATKWMSVKDAFFDEMSSMYQYLESQGFSIRDEMAWEKGDVYICDEFLVRIMENISSNILKYADSDKTIGICSEYLNDTMRIIIENEISSDNSSKESHNIGIDNIRTMMKKVGGDCIAFEKASTFKLILEFKYSFK